MRKKIKADTIPTTHACAVTEPGYYWARLVVWLPPAHLPQKRGYPMLCTPCIVELWFSSEGKPLVTSHLCRPERTQDWLFLQRVPDIDGYDPSNTTLMPEHHYLLEGPRAP